MSTNQCDIEGQGQPEIAMWPSKPEVHISDSMTAIITLPTANLGFSTTVSWQKVLTSNCNIERQPDSDSHSRMNLK